MNDQHDSRPHPGPVRPVCRRCRRPLRAAAAVAAGLGARCALLNALEAAQTAPPTSGQRVPETALALVTAALGELPRPVVDGILQDAPGADLAVLLASLSAWMLAHTTGGEQWLHHLGLAWAREGGG